jgi:hypothetical protein
VLARIPYLIPLYYTISALMLAWNVMAAGRISQYRRAPRRFAMLSAFAGLLVIPAAILAVAATYTLTGRALQPVAWVWPLTTILFVVQAVYATSRRLVTPLFGVPIVLYDVVIAAVAVSKYMTLRGGTPPDAALALAAAQANALGLVFGGSSLWRTYLQIPLLAPALPAHWRLTALGRVGLGTVAMVITGLVLIELPDGSSAVRSYERYATRQLQERPDGDFALGVKILPSVTASPPAHAMNSDTGLLRLLGTDAIAVVLRPEGIRAEAMDSLNRALEPLRTDATVMIVMLDYPRAARLQFQRSRDEYIADRARDVDRLTRFLRPTIVVPVMEPYGDGIRRVGLQPPEFWIEYLTRTSEAIHRVRPATRVAFAASSFGPRDSTLYSWAAAAGSPIDVLGFSLFPGFDGAATLDTRMRIAQRWMTLPSERPKNHWVFASGGFPGVHGERNQELAIWGTAAWATTQPLIRGMIVFESGDYDAIRGLRAPDSRFRSAVPALARARAGLQEAVEP